MAVANRRHAKNRRPLRGRRLGSDASSRSLFRRMPAASASAAFLVAEPGAAAHFHAAFFIDAEALGGDDLAFFDDVLDVFGAAFGQFGDVDEAVLAGQHFHERAEGGDGNDLAGVDLAHFDFLEHALDHRLGALQTFRLGGVDVNGAVVLDVDLGAGLGLDALDVLAARPDEFADAIGGDLDGDDARGVRAEFAVGA